MKILSDKEYTKLTALAVVGTESIKLIQSLGSDVFKYKTQAANYLADNEQLSEKVDNLLWKYTKLEGKNQQLATAHLIQSAISDAYEKTITQMSKKIKTQQAEIKRLNELLKAQNPVEKVNSKPANKGLDEWLAANQRIKQGVDIVIENNGLNEVIDKCRPIPKKFMIELDPTILEKHSIMITKRFDPKK